MSQKTREDFEQWYADFLNAIEWAGKTPEEQMFAAWQAALSSQSAEVERLRKDLAEANQERAWVRRKLKIPEDAGFVSGDPTLAGTMHVVCSHSHGYETYIETHKCDDKQGEIARLTVRAEKAEAELAAIRAQEPDRDEAYDVIDHFLRNNLDDSDYAEYSAALEKCYASPIPPSEENEHKCCGGCEKAAELAEVTKQMLWHKAFKDKYEAELVALAKQEPVGVRHKWKPDAPWSYDAEPPWYADWPDYSQELLYTSAIPSSGPCSAPTGVTADAEDARLQTLRRIRNLLETDHVVAALNCVHEAIAAEEAKKEQP